MRKLLAIAMIAASLSAGARADVSPLLGDWTGTATAGSEAVTAHVRFEACGQGVCARLSAPELGYAELPLGAVVDTEGAYRAGPLSFAASDEGLRGTLTAAADGVFIDALGHGGQAEVALHRGRPQRAEFREREVEFRSGALRLAGTLVRPRGRGPFPGIVAVLGSGDAARWASLARAREWARLGFAALIYDKRGAGASEGDWRNASLDDLADDAAAAMRFMQNERDVRADAVGYWAHSQGGWVAPRAIARGADAAFLIVVAGGGASPREVERYGYAGTLDHMGVNGAERARAETLIERYFTYLAGDIGLDELRRSMDEARETAWFRGLGISRVVPDEEARGNWRWVASYDPRADISALRTPTLIALGSGDHSSPLEAAMAGWTRALGPATRARIIVYPGADHHMRLGSEGGWRRVNERYAADVEQFLRQQAGR